MELAPSVSLLVAGEADEQQHIPQAAFHEKSLGSLLMKGSVSPVLFAILLKGFIKFVLKK